jgi:hypothetical protein
MVPYKDICNGTEWTRDFSETHCMAAVTFLTD